MYCADIPVVDNGYVISKNGTLLGDVIKYDCYEGYSISGADTITCGSGAQWSSAPSCVGKQPLSFCFILYKFPIQVIFIEFHLIISLTIKKILCSGYFSVDFLISLVKRYDRNLRHRNLRRILY